MLLERLGIIEDGSRPLQWIDLPEPTPGENDVVLRVNVCGVCHTELDEIEGRTAPTKLPVIPGHQAVGRISAVGSRVKQYRLGDRVGAAWIFSACGLCEYCSSDRENLCALFQATGRDRNGGYAEYMAVPSSFVFPIPPLFTDAQAAPLLCAGAIGYRSLRLTNLENGNRLGLTGFGSSAQLVLKMAKERFPASEIFVFARNPAERALALEHGAVWAGGTADQAPKKLDAIIDTTPAWTPVLEALRNLAPGGRLVINAIRKEAGDKAALLELDYRSQLWLEKEIKSVANVTRKDVREFLELAAAIGLEPQIQEYSLPAANEALTDLKFRPVTSAKVLRVAE